MRWHLSHKFLLINPLHHSPADLFCATDDVALTTTHIPRAGLGISQYLESLPSACVYRLIYRLEAGRYLLFCDHANRLPQSFIINIIIKR